MQIMRQSIPAGERRKRDTHHTLTALTALTAKVKSSQAAMIEHFPGRASPQQANHDDEPIMIITAADAAARSNCVSPCEHMRPPPLAATGTAVVVLVVVVVVVVVVLVVVVVVVIGPQFFL